MEGSYFLTHILLASAWCWGVHAVFTYGNIFGDIGVAIKGVIGETIVKPLYDCIQCMASVHGALWFFIFMDYPWYYVFVFMICLCGINTVVDRATE